MSKPRSKVSEYAVYLLVRVIVCVLQALSFRACCKVANGLAWLLYHVDRRHRLVALDNLRHAFGESYDQAERDRLVRTVYWHFCTMLMEIIHLPRMLHPQNWKQHIGLVDCGPMLDLLLSGRPVLVAGGHFGNWELGGYTLALFGFRTHAIARTLDNRYLDALLRRFRERTGQKVLAKDGDFERMKAVLARNGIMLTLGDQDAGQRGQFVDFFGRPASAHKAIAVFALQYNVPLIVMASTRGQVAPIDRGDGRGLWHFDIWGGDVILPEEYEGRRDAIAALTQRYTSALERMIRRHPEQYFWLHRRWKHQPKAKPPRNPAQNRQAA